MQVEVRTPVHCDTCEGSGAKPGTMPIRCPECEGTGEVRRVRQSILGQVITAAPCPRCQGTGQHIEQRCPDCRGEGRRMEDRTLTVDIPAGVDDGSTLRLAGHGPAGFRGGPNGALFVHVSVEPDAVFERSGVDLHAEVHVPVTMAALGGSLPFDTLDDSRELAVAAGTQSGTVLQLKGAGVPRLKGRGAATSSSISRSRHRPSSTSSSGNCSSGWPRREARSSVRPPRRGFLSKLRSALS